MISGKVEGLDVCIGGLENFGVDVREAAYYAVVEALKVAFEACQHLLSESDHTLRDLALMGHPYSVSRGFQIHSPDVEVHVQSGAYRDALKAISPIAAGGTILEGKIVNDSPIDEIIQNGTVVMRARPWMKYVVEQYGTDLADLIEARISAAIRAMAA